MYPRYLDVVKRIAQVERAEFRFIYIMRNPIDRIQSQMQHELADGVLQEAVVTEEQIAFSKYAMQLDTFAEAFGRDRLHLLLLEDLKQDPVSELRRLCEFLDIDVDYRFQTTAEVRNSREDPSVKLHPWVKKLYRVPAVNALSGLMPSAMKEKLYRPLANPQTFDVCLSEQQRADLWVQLKPDLERLEADYNFNVLHRWGVAP
ncbi:MAG: sulfotransferase domain-containing protein [Cyanobacteria bacterium P01_A01_bin.17]